MLRSPYIEAPERCVQDPKGGAQRLISGDSVSFRPLWGLPPKLS